MGRLELSYLKQYMFSPNGGYPIGGNFAPGIMVSTGTIPNENLQWGKSKDWNVGIDLGFWNNRVNATVEYYQRYRTNLVTSAPSYLFPPSVGNDDRNYEETTESANEMLMVAAVVITLRKLTSVNNRF